MLRHESVPLSKASTRYDPDTAGGHHRFPGNRSCPVPGYREAGYTVVATSRSIGPSDDPGEIDEVVDAIMYLEQAGFVAGEILHVDGGLSAGH